MRVMNMRSTMYDLAGGAPGMRQLAGAFYRRVFADPVMLPLFHNPDDDHVGRMALWLGEFFGGPAEHTRQRGGFITLITAHEGFDISDSPRQHWIEHILAACRGGQLPAGVNGYFPPPNHFRAAG